MSASSFPGTSGLAASRGATRADRSRSLRFADEFGSLPEGESFELSVPLATASLDSRGGEGAGGRLGGLRDAVPFHGGTSGSNPSRSSRESGEIVGSATLAGRGRCFTVATPPKLEFA